MPLTSPPSRISTLRHREFTRSSQELRLHFRKRTNASTLTGDKHQVPAFGHLILIETKLPYAALDLVPVVSFQPYGGSDAQTGTPVPIPSSVDDEVGCHNPMSTALDVEIIPTYALAPSSKPLTGRNGHLRLWGGQAQALRVALDNSASGLGPIRARNPWVRRHERCSVEKFADISRLLRIGHLASDRGRGISPQQFCSVNLITESCCFSRSGSQTRN